MSLSLKNPNLAEKLQTYIPTELPKLVQENGAYNILYKETLVHNPLNPLAESQEIFAQAENNPVSIHVIYGLGLGYLFQIASLQSQGTVILYEPDLNILWLALTLVDFSNDINKKNVFIVTDMEDLSKEIYKKSGIKNSPVLLTLPSQREFDNNKFFTAAQNPFFANPTLGDYTVIDGAGVIADEFRVDFSKIGIEK